MDPLLAQRVSLTKHPSGCDEALTGRQSGVGAGRLARRRRSRSPTPTPPSTWRSRPGTRQRLPAGSATPGRSSSGRSRRCRWATTAPGRTTCCRTGGSARFSAGLTAMTFLRQMQVIDYSRDALARWRRTCWRCRPPRICRPTARPSAVAVPGRAGMIGVDVTLADLPLRADLVGKSPYGAPQLDVPVQINTNENPYPPSDALVADLAGVGCCGGGRAEPVPGPGRGRAAGAVGGLSFSRRPGCELSSANVWAANGSNEILLQLLQAFAGPGRSALGLRAVVLDAPDHRLRHQDQLDLLPAAGRLHRRHRCRRGDWSRSARPDVLFITSPNNPTGGSLPLQDIRAAGARRRPASSWSTRRTRSSPTGRSAIGLIDQFPAQLVVVRTMSKAFAFAGGRLGLSGRGAGGDRRIVVGAAALSPVDADPGGRVGGAAARRRHPGLGRASGRRAASGCAAALVGQRVSTSSIPMRTSCCSARSTTQAAAWRQYLDAGVLVRDMGIPGYLRATIGTDAGERRAAAT